MKHFQSQNSQKGQIFIGYYGSLIAIMLLAVIVGDYLINTRKSATNRHLRDMAVYVARTGFEDGLSYFRRQSSGEFLASQISNGQAWVDPGNWSEWPDAAFNPTSNDTMYYNMLSVTTGNSCSPCARAIVKTFMLNVTYTAATQLSAGNTLWGRYVIKRQNTRNWSPGPNTYSAFSDPDAVHDITHLRSTMSSLGVGNYWGLTSIGYVFAAPSDVTSLASITGTAGLNNIAGEPRTEYPGSAPFLLAKAKVYGELFRINFNVPNAAVTAPNKTCITGNSNGNINGATEGAAGVGLACASCGSPTGPNFFGGTTNVTAPTVPSTFPGLDKNQLQGLANHLGDESIFPMSTDADLTEVASRFTFYYLKVTYTGRANAFTFAYSSGAMRVMQGVGLVFVDGDLVIQAKNTSSWAGIVFVDGKVTLNGPAEISGTLITTSSGAGTVIVQGSSNKAFVEFSSDAINNTKNFLQDFKIIKSSMVTSYF